MSDSPVERKLAAIFAADIAGYSRLMARDEPGTLARLKACRVITDGLIAAHRGRIFNTAGDSVVADFASAVDAVTCAAAVQRAMAKEDAADPGQEPMHLRIGIHVGDVMVDGTNLLGDGVNIAARLEALADPGGICISAIVHDQVQGRLTSCTFEDIGERKLKNITRPVRVYRLVLGSQASRPQAAGTAAESTSNPVLAPSDKPSVAVLPFQNMSGDSEQEYFADGMVEEIITALSRIRWLLVIARNSSFTYKGQPVDVKRVGHELGVRYVLEGSVRKSAGRVRITAQLIDSETGVHIWADRFDGSLEDVFDLQDQVAISVAGVIEPALQAAETARSARRPTADLTAYDLYLRAYETFVSSAAKTLDSLHLVEQAITRDPRYGPALAWAAFCRFRLDRDGHAENREANRVNGVGFARRALEVAADDPVVLTNAALALAWFGEDINAMLALADRAIALNPSFARGWYISGLLRLYAGQLDVAIEHEETALRLSPRARVGAPLTVIGGAHLLASRFDQAIPKLLLAAQMDPTNPQTYRWLAAAYAHLGLLEDAAQTVERLRSITPDLIGDSFPRIGRHRELYVAGLRLAAGAAP